MTDEVEMMFPAQILLLALDSPVNKFDNSATFQADEMVMVGLGQFVLVTEASVADVQLADEAYLLKDIQGPVDGSPGDRDSPPPQ